MKLLRRLLLPALALAALSARAQPYPYAGSDDFNDGTISASWSGFYTLSGTTAGLYTEPNGYMQFTAGTGNKSGVLRWNNSVNNAYNEDWTAQLTLTNLTTPASGYSLIGLQVFAANNLDVGLFGAYAYSHATNGQNLLVEKGYGPIFTLTSYVESPAVTDLSDLTVRFTHSAATHDITIAYSNDGATFYDSITFNPGTDWSGAPTAGYSFRVMALSTAEAIGAGQMYVDNFSVSAIPEPSTYAAFAGLGALGLALWRRRRSNLAA